MGMEHIHKGAQMALQAFGITDQAKQRAMMEKLTGAQIGQFEASQATAKEMMPLQKLVAQMQIAKGMKDINAPVEWKPTTQEEAVSLKNAGQGWKPQSKEEAVEVKTAGQGWKPQSKQEAMDVRAAGKDKSPSTLEGILAKKVHGGELTWDQAIKMKSEAGGDKKAKTYWERFFQLNPEASVEDMQKFTEGMRKADKEPALRELDIIAKSVGVDLKGDITLEQSNSIITKLVEMRKWSLMGALMGLQGGGTPAPAPGKAGMETTKPTVKLDGIIK